jgi:signal transduction histidine kinase
MELVAAARMRRAQERVLAARPYSDEIASIMTELMRRSPQYEHPFLKVNEVQKRLIILVTADRGLAGALNSNNTRLALSDAAKTAVPVSYVTIGRRGRDVVRRLHRDGGAVLEQKVSDIMTSEVRTCAPEDNLEHIARIMTEIRVRHLPVVSGGELVAIISIGDVVKNRIDELQVDRLLTNLVDNAIDFTPVGGAIELGARVEDGQLLAWVANDGPMIPAADLQSIFDKFWTGRSTGTGLGLAIARLIVERHGGKIEVRNRRTGPRFQFTLPLAVAVSRR